MSDTMPHSRREKAVSGLKRFGAIFLGPEGWNKKLAVLPMGATIFDRRPNSTHRADIEVAMEIDTAAVADCVVRGLAEAGRQT